MTDDSVALPLTPDKGLSEGLLRTLRPLGSWYIRRRWEISERGDEKVPDSGPVILASNHIGWLDGPLLIATAPRPAHALVKQEMFSGRTGALLRGVGQISVHRDFVDAGAVRKAVQALRAGQMVVLYPEGTRGGGEFEQIKDGLAYLALVSGAPVVPVAIFGTRLAGEPSDARPEKGARIDIVYGSPIQFEPRQWPRPKESVSKVSRRVREHLVAHVQDAKMRTERELPGPLKPGDKHG